MEGSSLRAENLIHEYEMELFPPPCLPGAADWSARVCVKTDTSVVLPYLNSVLKCADYDHSAKVLIWKDRGHKYAFRSGEIKVAPVRDREEARDLIDEIVDKVNAIWRRRCEITPDFGKRTIPDLMKVCMLLPRTNCGACGCSTCMAFAADLREGKAELTRCSLLGKPEYAGNRIKLQDLFGTRNQLENGCT